MHSHLVVFFRQEKNVGTEYECYHLIEFQHRVQAPDQEAAERIKLLKILKDYLHVVYFDGMMFAQYRDIILQSQFLTMFVGFAEFLVNLPYDVVSYHFFLTCETSLTIPSGSLSKIITKKKVSCSRNKDFFSKKTGETIIVSPAIDLEMIMLPSGKVALTQEAEEHTCRNRRSYYPGNIRPHGVHEEIVGGIVFQTQIVGYSCCHRHS